MKKRMEGFQKPAPTSTKKVGLAMVSDPEPGYKACSCGAQFFHVRAKVRDEWAERHLAKRHNGEGLWL